MGDLDTAVARLQADVEWLKTEIHEMRRDIRRIHDVELLLREIRRNNGNGMSRRLLAALLALTSILATLASIIARMMGT